MVQTCQTCLRMINNPSRGFYIDSSSSSFDGLSFKEMLTDCIPELILDSVPNPAMCHSCIDHLKSAYQFKQQCLEVQQKVYGYLQQMPLNTPINMEKIATYYHRLEIVFQEEPSTKRTPRNPNRAHSFKMPHKCVHCNFSCADECVIRYHLIMHKTKDAPYKCDKCTFIFPTEVLLLDHLAAHTNENPYWCTLCDFVTASFTKLKEHGRIHRKMFQCNICWKRFAERQELRIHLDVHDNELEAMKYQCGWCDFKCDQIRILNLHLHHGHKETYKCSACAVECRTQDGLARHRRRVHGEVEKYQDVPNIYEDLNEDVGMDNDVIIVLDNDSDKNEAVYENLDTLNSKITPGSNCTNMEADSALRRTFVCRKCSAEFPSDGSLKNHYKKCQNNLMTQPQHSNQTSLYENFNPAVDVLTTNVHANTAVNCESLPRSTLKQMTSTGNTIFKCHLCTYATKKYNRWKKHMHWHKMQLNVIPPFSDELIDIMLNQPLITQKKQNVGENIHANEVQETAQFELSQVNLNKTAQNIDVSVKIKDVHQNLNSDKHTKLGANDVTSPTDFNLDGNCSMHATANVAAKATQNVDRIVKVFSCKHCSLQCMSSSALRRHYRSKHRTPGVAYTVIPSQFNYPQSSPNNSTESISFNAEVFVPSSTKPSILQSSIEKQTVDLLQVNTKKMVKCKKCPLEFETRKLCKLHYAATHSLRAVAELQHLSQNAEQESHDPINQVSGNADLDIHTNDVQATNTEENLNANIQTSSELKCLFLDSLQATKKNVISTIDVKTIHKPQQAAGLREHSNIETPAIQTSEKQNEDCADAPSQNATKSDSKQYQCSQCLMVCKSWRNLRTRRRRFHAKRKVNSKAENGDNQNRASVSGVLENVETVQHSDDKSQDVNRTRKEDQHDSSNVEQSSVGANSEIFTVENVISDMLNNVSNEQEKSDSKIFQSSSVDENIHSSDLRQSINNEANQNLNKELGSDFLSTHTVPDTKNQNQLIHSAQITKSFICLHCQSYISKTNLKQHMETCFKEPASGKHKFIKTVNLFECDMCNFWCETEKIRSTHWQLVHSEGARENLQLLDQLELHEIEQKNASGNNGGDKSTCSSSQITEVDENVKMGTAIHISEDLETVVTSEYINVKTECVATAKRKNSDAFTAVSKRQKLDPTIEQKNTHMQDVKVPKDENSCTTIVTSNSENTKINNLSGSEISVTTIENPKDNQNTDDKMCIKQDNSDPTSTIVKRENLDTLMGDENSPSNSLYDSVAIKQENLDTIRMHPKQENLMTSIVKEEHTVKSECDAATIKHENLDVTAVAVKQENLDTADASMIAAMMEQQNLDIALNKSVTLIQENVVIVIDDD